MYDLALSAHGDLVIAGNKDVAGISGIDLIEQRIVFRLRLRRGSWIYDDTHSIGSHLTRLIGMSASEVHSAVGPYVREALRGIEEISVEDVQHVHEPTDAEMDIEGHSNVNTGVLVLVLYRVVDESDETGEIRQISVEIPTGGGV